MHDVNILDKIPISEGTYTNMIFKICQYFKNLTVVNADGIKQIVKLGVADIGLYCLSNLYNLDLTIG